MKNQTERKASAAVSWLGSPLHPYEDRFRLLPKEIPLVGKADRGELFAVFDGISSAPKGMGAAQAMADSLLAWFREPDRWVPSEGGLSQLLHEANQTIFDWGLEPGTSRPIGGCAGSVAWVHQGQLAIFHAGDTLALLLRPDQRPRLLTRAHEIDGALDRYFGLGRHLTIDIERVPLEEGDLVLLMSDGVTKAFGASEAADLVQAVFDRCNDHGRATEELVARSRAKGSLDDITALIIEFMDE